MSKDGELTCSKRESVGCNSASQYAAQCTDGATVVDVYVYDVDHVGQMDGSDVLVPLACDASGDRSKCAITVMC